MIMRFFLFLDKDNEPLYINLDFVVALQKAGNGCYICMANGATYQVSLTPCEVFNQLQGWPAGTR